MDLAGASIQAIGDEILVETIARSRVQPSFTLSIGIRYRDAPGESSRRPARKEASTSLRSMRFQAMRRSSGSSRAREGGEASSSSAHMAGMPASKSQDAQLREVAGEGETEARLGDIRAILERPESERGDSKRRMVELNAEIQALRGHQRAILKLLQHKFSSGRKKVITKEKWVAIMKASGFSEADMRKSGMLNSSVLHPEEHQEFCVPRHPPRNEIRSIREWSRERTQRLNWINRIRSAICALRTLRPRASARNSQF